jgi:hypothetical protein
LINLCGVYHHDADGATAECMGLFGSLLSPRWMDALGMVVFHKDDLRMPGTAISGVGAVLVMAPTKSRGHDMAQLETVTDILRDRHMRP